MTATAAGMVMPGSARLRSTGTLRSDAVVASTGYRELERLGAARISKPHRAPEWEWFYALGRAERLWLSRWFMVDGGPGPDEVADWLGFGADIDGAMAVWLAAARATRQVSDDVTGSDSWDAAPAEADPWSDDALSGVVVGAQEAAELFGWQIGTFHKWQHRRVTPPRDMTVNGAPAWWATTVRDWAHETGRLGAGRRVTALPELECSDLF